MYNKLADISSIIYGKSPASVLDADGAFPVLGTGGEYARANSSMFGMGIVVPRKGSLGNPQLAMSPFWAADTTFAVLPEANVDVRWLYYCLANYDLSRLNEATGVPSISRDWLSKVAFFNPGFSKQKKVASILQTIDRVIEKTEVLIDKNQQIKAGLMHDLFTRGIGADGQLRPPREQAPEVYQKTLIGWIPNEWRLVPLGQLAEIVSGVTLGGDRKGEMVVPYLRVANVQDGYLDLDEVKSIYINRREFQKLALKPGDVLMNEGGDFDKLGRGTVWEGEIENCVHQNHVFRVRTNESLLRPRFLAAWSQSYYGKSYFLKSSKQSTNLASINSAQLKSFPVGLADLAEQFRIERANRLVSDRIEYLRLERKKYLRIKRGLMKDLLSGAIEVDL